MYNKIYILLFLHINFLYSSLHINDLFLLALTHVLVLILIIIRCINVETTSYDKNQITYRLHEIHYISNIFIINICLFLSNIFYFD